MPPVSRDAPPGGTPSLATTRTGAGERLVLVHGFTQTGRSWQPVARRFAGHHEVVTVDLPGHGRSAATSARDLDEAGRRVVEAGGGATYLGYSMGGRVVLHAAFAAPELVRRLVLVGANPGIEDTRERERRRLADEALAARLTGLTGDRLALDEFLAEWLAAPLFAHLDETTAGLAARRENTTAGLAGALRTLGVGTQRCEGSRLRALRMPVLVLAGELDTTYDALGRRLAAQIGANATFASLPGVGHAAPFEAPDRFAALVEAWLASHPTP
jgi:2-succinyl-6-hydroxy-2,4-cyclohexadiene-1-carboxylate synthase